MDRTGRSSSPGTTSASDGSPCAFDLVETDVQPDPREDVFPFSQFQLEAVFQEGQEEGQGRSADWWKEEEGVVQDAMGLKRIIESSTYDTTCNAYAISFDENLGSAVLYRLVVIIGTPSVYHMRDVIVGYETRRWRRVLVRFDQDRPIFDHRLRIRAKFARAKYLLIPDILLPCYSIEWLIVSTLVNLATYSLRPVTSTRKHHFSMPQHDRDNLEVGKLGPNSSVSPSAFTAHRPTFHLLPPRNWLNDPCAPYLTKKGTYQVFFQYTAEINEWHKIQWGCAESDDLMDWRVQRDAVLVPNKDGSSEVETPYDIEGVFTGCMLSVPKGTRKKLTGKDTEG
jgi:hypothetical protein